MPGNWWGIMNICRSLRDIVAEDMGICPFGMNFIILNSSGEECFKTPGAVD